jgi:hypothetical protein
MEMSWRRIGAVLEMARRPEDEYAAGLEKGTVAD